MSDHSGPGIRLLGRAVRAYVHADQLLFRGQQAVRAGLRGLLGEALSAREQRELTVRGYGAFWPVRAPSHAELFPWEARWFERRLPPAPARVLVGGAGTGREPVALVAAGYDVDCLEPARELVDRCRRAVPGGVVLQATYEELAAAVLDGAGGPAAAVAGQSYDAGVLGWTSLSYVF